MSRTINWDEPLSDEDRTWAEQRDVLHSKIEENDQKFGGKKKAPKQNRQERMDELRSIIADSENELQRLQQEQIDEDNKNAALTGDVRTGNGIVDNTPVNGEAPAGAPTAADNYADEQRWTKANLVKEIESRNAERVAEDLPPISKSGNRSELVERLMADDAELAGN
jgi:hypothetical protein